MRDLQTSACFVTSAGRKLIGVVRDKDMLRLVRDGGTNIGDALKPTPSIVSPDQLIAELFELAVESPLPVAVVDDQDRLIGVVPRVTLLASLTSLPTMRTEIPVIEPTPDVPRAIITATLEATDEGTTAPEELASAEGSAL